MPRRYSYVTEREHTKVEVHYRPQYMLQKEGEEESKAELKEELDEESKEKVPKEEGKTKDALGIHSATLRRKGTDS